MSPERANTREALVEAGRTLFARHGYDGASIRAITRRAHSNLGAVTYHFGSKKALYGTVLDGVFDPLRQRLEPVASGPGSPLERMDGVVRTFFSHLAENPDIPQLLLQQIAAGRRAPTAVVRTMRGILGLLSTIIVEGQQDGSIRPGDPLLMSLSVIAQPVHLTLVRPLARQALGIDLDEPSQRADLVEHAVRFARAGLSATESNPS
jgi:AcrR family transcriptional regulator